MRRLDVRKLIMRIDYYKFDCFNPYVFGGLKFPTLRDAKHAYCNHLKKGHRLGQMIYGFTKKDDCVFLSYTPFWSDCKTFGKTKLTWAGENNIRNGKRQHNHLPQNK